MRQIMSEQLLGLVSRVRYSLASGRSGLFAARVDIAVEIGTLVARKNLGANFLLQDFPHLRTRQLGPDVHLLRRLDAADAPFDESDELFDAQRAARVGLDNGGDSLAPFCI